MNKEDRFITLVHNEDKNKLKLLIGKYNKGEEIFAYIDGLLSKQNTVNYTDAEIYKMIKGKFGTPKIFTDTNFRGNKRSKDVMEIIDKCFHGKNIKSYLDIGVGSGEITEGITILLNEKYGEGEVMSFGIDIADERKIKTSSYNFDVYNGEKIPYGGADLITCSMVLHHVPKLDTFVESLYKSLNTGGILIVREHNITDNSELNLVSLQHRIMAGIYGETIYVHEMYENYMTKKKVIDVLTGKGFKQVAFDDSNMFSKTTNITKYIYLVFTK